MSNSSTQRVICRASSVVMPKGGDRNLTPPPPKPCVTILIHGVNDLAGVYASIESGLCAGLNERMDLAGSDSGSATPGKLVPASYTLPTGTAAERNPDAVYYRRAVTDADAGGTARSVVIPFYWGFREEEVHINKTAPHGEWLDRDGNRLDKAGTKEGGFFANATTTVPDMWGDGFSGKLFGIIPMRWFSPTPSHPLFRAAGRRYMVLAAMRLAMLIKIIRKRYPDDAINIVGHSQGNLINLLAQAFLADEKDPVRPADCVVMLNPPYSLHEPGPERMQQFGDQQTTQARIKTLQGVVDFIAAKAAATPTLPSVSISGCTGYGAIGGARWTGGSGSKAAIDGNEAVFDERDNRGCTYLYFTPQDQTVGLGNVQGIGWQGVADTVNGQAARSVLGPRFHQRVFTLRKRDGEREKVGARPLVDRYSLLLAGERTWEDTGLSWFDRNAARGEFDVGQTVQLHGAPLPSPVEVNFANGGNVTQGNTPADAEATQSGVYQVKTQYDPIDASIVLANGGWRPDDRSLSRIGMMSRQDAYRYGHSLADVTRAYNEGKAEEDHAHVFSALDFEEGVVQITRGETPYEARLRLQNQTLADQEALSFHSGIPANPLHSQRVLAYDLAVGAGGCVDDVEFYAYLCRVADWRLDWKRTRGDYQPGDNSAGNHPTDAVLDFYLEEASANRELIDNTSLYRSSTVVEYDGRGNAATLGGGVLPQIVQDAKFPSLIDSQTRSQRRENSPKSQGSA